MASGTKIFLAVVAILVVILVLYYGFLMPEPDTGVVMGTRDANQPAQTEPGADEPDEYNQATGRRSRSDMAAELSRSPSVTMSPPPFVTEAADATSDEAAASSATDGHASPEVSPATSGRAAEARSDGEVEAPDPPPSPVTIPADADDTGGKDGPAPALSAASDQSNDSADEASHDLARDETAGPASRPSTTPATTSLRRPPTSSPDATSRTGPRDDDELTPPQYTIYTVKPGDLMSTIAAEWFGDPGKWDLIAKANPYVDPNRLSIGQELRLPPKDAEREEITGRAGSRATTYTVRSGDNLSRIARAYYGDSGLWRIIYEANRPTIGLSPDNLKVGMRLMIPPAPKPADEENSENLSRNP